ncbi:FecR domain-containing protein [Pseudomonas sp. 21LCFQ010]|uniref:FecR domain-containing protein n=1 Tax=Pseudomonas sp. 21LCFQ010 TaxID=2957506 RepID=UPI00209712BA|nr:FecR domain-containing protein [Pseudomonas sp. 21LCFQ010]
MSGDSQDQARQLAHAAAYWLALIESGSASAEDHARLRHWREQSHRHEQMWQKAQGLRQRFAEVPAQLALASLDRPGPDLQRRAVLKRALVVAALLPAGWLLSRQLPLANWSADLRTATGERRMVSLPDGSQLQLNTATAVDLEWRAGQHQLRLIDGELALNMAADAQQVSIQTRLGQISASAAELCVRQDARRCRVSVSRGSVELRSASGAIERLQAGQRASLNIDGITPIERFDARQPDWRMGVLSAENRPLGSFLTELGRYRPGILRWEPGLEQLAVTGSFRLDDTEQILDLLAASLPLQVQRRTRYWVTLVARPKVV